MPFSLCVGGLNFKKTRNKKVRAHQLGMPCNSVLVEDEFVLNTRVKSCAKTSNRTKHTEITYFILQFNPVCIGGVGIRVEQSERKVAKGGQNMKIHAPKTAKDIISFSFRHLRIAKLATLRLAGYRGRKVIQATLNAPAKTDLSVRIQLRRLKRKLHF